MLKLLHDHFPGLQVVASGSASVDLRQKTGQPLTGRQIVLDLLPLSLGELTPRATTLHEWVEHGMIFGGYPEIVALSSSPAKNSALRQLAADYLLKDIFSTLGFGMRCSNLSWKRIHMRVQATSRRTMLWSFYSSIGIFMTLGGDDPHLN